MLLQRLKEYYEKRLEDEPPSMYIKTPIKWIIDLSKSGEFQRFVPTMGKRERNDRGREFMAPHIGRTSGIRAKLLVDNGEYVLGIPRDKSKSNRARECHKAFLDTLRQCVDATGEEAVRICLRFLETQKLQSIPLPSDFDPSQNITFRVNGIMPIDLPAIREYWKRVATEEDLSKEGKMECLICGRICSPVDRLPFKIKGIPGGQPSGMAIISANKPAFESFGLKASLISPTCQKCGERFSKAANLLIQDEKTHIIIGPVVYLFWTKEEIGFSLVTFFQDPDPKEVKVLIESVWKGEKHTPIDETAFYATVFSANGGRVVVRDWLETTVGEIKRNLARWFTLQQIVGPNGEEGRPLRLQELADATVPMKGGKPDREKLSPQLQTALLHTALQGDPLPKWILSQAINRNKAEQKVTQSRAALIKMVLFSNKFDEGGEKMECLDLGNRNPAYLCGRLLALLEEIQREAIPDLITTIVDKFFGTASSAPASVFGRLLRGSQAHLGKLHRDNPSAYYALQQRLEEILSGLEGFPKVLTLEEQGLFSLGYYHQRAANRAAAKAHKEAKSKKEEEEDV